MTLFDDDACADGWFAHMFCLFVGYVVIDVYSFYLVSGEVEIFPTVTGSIGPQVHWVCPQVVQLDS